MRSDHDRLAAIHTMLDPSGNSLKSIEELIEQLQYENAALRSQVGTYARSHRRLEIENEQLRAKGDSHAT